MDDYNISSLSESKNEWAARLNNILTPCIIQGIKSIFDESYKLCIDNDEETKYLMTFQNLLNNVPKWSNEIVNTEKERILTSSGCNYLEDLLSCVHIAHLKSLTATRVGIKQKKININIPDLDKFIHKTYINVARKIYVNVYLFEKDILPLQIQKNNRELELIIKECILNTIRESIPIENILRTYLDETVETDVEVEEKREVIPDKKAIEKKNKEKQEKELNDLKQKLKDKEKDEKSLKETIKDINKSLNMDEVETDNKVETDITGELNNKDDNHESEDDNGTLKLDNNSDSLNLGDLNVESLNEDVDKINTDELNLDEIVGDDSDLDLDIEELK